LLRCSTAGARRDAWSSSVFGLSKKAAGFVFKNPREADRAARHHASSRQTNMTARQATETARPTVVLQRVHMKTRGHEAGQDHVLLTPLRCEGEALLQLPLLIAQGALE